MLVSQFWCFCRDVAWMEGMDSDRVGATAVFILSCT